MMRGYPYYQKQPLQIVGAVFALNKIETNKREYGLNGVEQ